MQVPLLDEAKENHMRRSPLFGEQALMRNPICAKCKGETKLEVHHVIPFSRGGLDDSLNAVVLCHWCHLVAHDGLRGTDMAPVRKEPLLIVRNGRRKQEEKKQDWTAERIRLIRERCGLTQEQFAERVGCSQQRVSEWETGAAAPSRYNHVVALLELEATSK